MRGWLLIACFCLSAAAAAKPPPATVEALRTIRAAGEIERVGEIDGGEGYTAALYRYQSAGLTVHAMVATPLAAAPEGGFPMLVFNHGYHPDPPRYGISADGRDWRPGDYYRRIPSLYAGLGYLVVIPDYRGHSGSQGFEFTEGLLAAAYYAEDVVHLLQHIDAIPHGNPDRLFMMGHSMGGDVTLRALLASGRVRAASMWSTVGGDLWDQAYYYSRYDAPHAMDDSEQEKPLVEALRRQIASLDAPFDSRRADPYCYIDELHTPLIIHHSIDDRATDYAWSVQLAQALSLRGRTYRFFSYPGDAHLFGPDDMASAAARDVAFFSEFDRP